MKKIKLMLIPILAVALLLITFAGCSSSDGEFSYSSGITDDGFWKGITALDHVELGKYEGISIPQEVYQVSEESVQAEIDGILANFTSQNQITDREVMEGDTVNIDYTGSVDGQNFEGGSTEGMGTEVTIGVTSYIEGFLEQLVGHSPGESFDIEVTFPQDYGNPELDGKDAVFAITINHIVETETPELTDDFVADNLSLSYGWNTVEEMETDIRDNLQSSAISYYIQEYIVDNADIKSIPETLVEYQEKSLILYYQDSAEYYEMEFDEFLTNYMNVSSTDELLETFAEDNRENAKFYLIIQAIAEDAGISVTDEDLNSYFTDHIGAEDYAEYEENFGIPYLKLIVLNQKVLDYLGDKAVLE
ncbi:MAG: trigger factor [Actinomycetia bacterium]|nr:trigger factor [Actinomycetes bacterium]